MIAGVTVTFIPSASDIVIGTQTILPGSAVTISVIRVSLGLSGLVVGAVTGTVPLMTVPLPSGPATAATGFGGMILSLFNGPVAGPAGSGNGNATATIKPFVGGGAKGLGEARGVWDAMIIVVGLGIGLVV